MTYEDVRVMIDNIVGSWSTHKEDLIDEVKEIASEIGGYVEEFAEGSVLALMFEDEDGEDYEINLTIEENGRSYSLWD